MEEIKTWIKWVCVSCKKAWKSETIEYKRCPNCMSTNLTRREEDEIGEVD